MLFSLKSHLFFWPPSGLKVRYVSKELSLKCSFSIIIYLIHFKWSYNTTELKVWYVLNECLLEVVFLLSAWFISNSPVGHSNIRSAIYLCIYLLTQVACALLMAGENLDNHVDVKKILVEMGTYFQVQVILS